MKKIVLSLAGALAATAFAPEASAIPSFARQTGMACQACHQQHFPILNSFGRAFKSAGYTMMGAQDKVEGDHLSIPATLNASMLIKIRYFKSNQAGAANTTLSPTNNGNGALQFMDEAALFFGGRVADNIGFMFEGNLVSNGNGTGTGANPNSGQLMAGFKMPFTFDMGGAKLAIIPFSTDALSAQYGFELSSGGVMRANRWNENRRETSAIQYNADRGADGGAATGVALVAMNDMGYINVTRWSPSFLPGSNGQAGANASTVEMKSNYIRVAATPTLGGWASVIGVGRASGTSYSNVKAGPIETDQTFFDAQFHGEVGGKELGVYFQHAKAPATINTNAYNTGAMGNPDRKATTIGADYSVIPHVLSIAASYRSAKTGGAAATNGDNAALIGLVYDVTQNVALHANYMSYSGSNHNAVGALKNQYMWMLEAAF